MRDQAYQFGVGLIDHQTGLPGNPDNVYSPLTKAGLVESGGIGTIRLWPRKIDDTDCWLATALSGQHCAAGIPLAIPHSLLQGGGRSWGDTVTFYGRVRRLEDAGLKEVAFSVHHASPAIVFVEKIEDVSIKRRKTAPVIISPVVLTSSKKNPNEYGYTFAHCESAPESRTEAALEWMIEYALCHNGQIITNFDETNPRLAGAPLSYQRLVGHDYDSAIAGSMGGAPLMQTINNVNVLVSGHVMMRKQFNIHGPAGVVGDHANIQGNVNVQSSAPGSTALADLQSQLARVRVEMKRLASPNDLVQDAEIGEIARAEKAAKSGDKAGVMNALKGAGHWTLEVVKSVAAELVKDAIEGKIG